ncbi:S-layer family protein [Nodularia sp. UHCC 0506]|uniref:S-layer family protein n=1 Tax=Nodularia sp. UHCC 0506 TaxID=3110243 RepID=UPI002B1F0594|nr:S-layer family protein [Nodularia sp. UHCC 0506]MEA5513413.1 S-layer family protein [Nodularia sp. UHCC 0506]
MKLTSIGLSLLSLICLSALGNNSVHAQITQDNTLNTSVTSTTSINGNNIYSITNGTRVGNNLFHGFSQFSIPTNDSILFENHTSIQNIFSRVTGGNVSHINGSISANGNANLFLINPAGIIFGQNASLNIGGSFVGTTANSIKFADGTEFIAVPGADKPLLTMSAPVGLQMGSNSGSITTQGRGYTNSGSSIFPTPNSTELQVNSGKTLALVGGNLQIDGFILTAPEGQIELGSTNGTGQVNLIPNAQGYTLGYEEGQIFGDIQLAEKSLINVSGINSGSVRLQARNIRLTAGSLILAQNYGDLPGGEISLQASTGIDLIGRSSDGNLLSGVRSETYGMGAGGNIGIFTPRFTLLEGAGLNNITAGIAPSGNIEIDAETIEISGFSQINPNGVTGISTLSFASGSAGDVFVNGDNLLISGGASLSSVTFGSGSSGKISIRNQNTTVIGNSPSGFDSAITLATFAFGDNKDLILNTGKLQILDGGRIGSSTLFAGNGGNVSINASEAIAISGRNNSNNSAINSSATHLNAQLRQTFGFPDMLTANAGSLSITTPNLSLTDGATVTVTSEGTGNAGSLNIIADIIQLKNQALIQAQTESGNGGNIDLKVGSLLLMRDRSQITSTAQGNGNGGNITMNSPIIFGWENSDIIANAFQGKGGNINIQAQGILGLEFRQQLTPENDITASSQFGLSGTVQVNTVGVDPNSGLVELPTNVTDPSQQITTGCSNTTDSSFVSTGRGGIPQNPTQEVRSDRPWSDVRNISAFQKKQTVQAQVPTQPQIPIQATAWHRNTQGNIELVAELSSTQTQLSLTCAAMSKN